MKITTIESVTLGVPTPHPISLAFPEHRLVCATIQTDEGLTGFGYSLVFGGGGAEAIQAYLETRLKPLLIGEAQRYAALGCRYHKTKIHHPDPRVNRQRVETVRQALGEGVRLMVDVNQKLDVLGAIRQAALLEDPSLNSRPFLPPLRYSRAVAASNSLDFGPSVAGPESRPGLTPAADCCREMRAGALTQLDLLRMGHRSMRTSMGVSVVT